MRGKYFDSVVIIHFGSAISSCYLLKQHCALFISYLLYIMHMQSPTTSSLSLSLSVFIYLYHFKLSLSSLSLSLSLAFLALLFVSL